MHTFRRIAGSLAFLLCVFSHAQAETTFYSASPLEGELEPDYAKAILKLRAGALDDAVRALETLRAKVTGPSAGRDRRRILELEALARALQDDGQRSRELHEKILALVKEQKVPAAEGAPSHFAIALADLKAGKLKEAHAGFELAHRLDYNVPACHLFLGYLDFQERDYELAERNFRQVMNSNVSPEVRGLASLYLSKIATLQGRGTAALRYAKDAYELSPDGRVRVAANEKIMSAAQVEGFHETAGLDFRFDSNSATLPLGPNPTDSGFASNDGPSGFGNELDLWLGYVSSPLNAWQWSIAARSDILAHWGTSARFADFYSQQLNVVVSRSPLEAVSFGFKLGIEGMWTTEDLKPYHLRENVGVYFRRELKPELVLLAEFAVRPTKDNSADDLIDRSGPALDLRVSLFSDTARPWWNPGLSVWIEHNHTGSTEFRSTTFGLDFNNLYFASENWKGSMGASFGVSAYVDRPGKSRYDPFLGVNASAQYALSWRYFLRSAASFLGDFSTVHEPYRFSRFTASAGFGINL